MSMVPAICTQCGGIILVDDSHDAGICEYCGTAFITEKAINNYQNTINITNATINVAGTDVNNILLRAKSFEESGNLEKAIEYYNKVLDTGINNFEANEALKRLTKTYYIGQKPVSKFVCDEIEGLLATGEKIKAIKCAMNETGYGLADAKYLIESHSKGNWEPHDLNGGKSQNSAGCFIATSVYGSYDCPQVWTLRRYRDEILTSTWYGRTFIRVYYTISPTLVKWFGKTAWFKNLWKPKLDRMVFRLNREGVEDSPYKDKNW